MHNAHNETIVVNAAAPIGAYVKYKGKDYIILDFDNSMQKVLIMNPLYGNRKLNVLISNVSATNHEEAQCVEHKGHRYLITRKGWIISMRTNKIMLWDEHNGDRKAICATANVHPAK